MVRVFHVYNIGKIMAALWFFGRPWGYSAYPVRFSLDSKRMQKSEGTWWDHGAQETGVALKSDVPGSPSILYAFTMCKHACLFSTKSAKTAPYQNLSVSCFTTSSFNSSSMETSSPERKTALAHSCSNKHWQPWGSLGLNQALQL